jgi:hypothetical protein
VRDEQPAVAAMTAYFMRRAIEHGAENPRKARRLMAMAFSLSERMTDAASGL